MAKMLTFTQGDYGMSINIQILNDKKELIHILEEDKVFAHIQYPSGECKDVDEDNLFVIDRLKGIIRFVIKEEYTEEEGFYQVFVGIESPEYKINANKAISYFVNAKHGIGQH